MEQNSQVTDEEIGPENLSDLPKVTPRVKGTVTTQDLWLPEPAFSIASVKIA